MLYTLTFVTDGLPTKEGWYFTNQGQAFFDIDEMVFRYQCLGRIVYVSYWLELVHTPNDSEIDKLAKKLAKESTAPDKDTPDWMESDIRRGIKAGINLLINKQS